MSDNGLQTRPESLAAIRLLQGVIYSVDAGVWQQVLTYRSDLEDYFGRIGLVLMVAEDDGLAYLRQRSDDERDADGDGLPRMVTRMPLSLNVTMLFVILRDEYRRFEDIDLDNTRCTVTIDDLLPTWKSMQPSKYDDVRNRETLVATMRKVEQMSIVAKFGEADEFEIKPILKARMPIDSLVELRDQMKRQLEEKG